MRLYAVAAMAGSTARVIGLRLGLPAPATALLGGVVCFGCSST